MKTRKVINPILTCLLTAYCLLPTFFSFSQLVIDTTYSVEQLVEEVFIGSGVYVNNITFSGAGTAKGAFSNGQATNLGLAQGIILSTGKAMDAAGIVGNFASTDNQMGSDADLQNLIPTYTVNDATVLEFDFQPISDTIKFRYVFGSEEYPEWVNSLYNDVFGFFVTGPKPTGGYYNSYNIALIPGTALPVTIDNVNNVIPSYPQYYVDNQGIGGTTIVYDGFTTVLTAWCLVIPCSTYHLKIAIGDAGDYIYDSAVFLEEKSFSSGSIDLQAINSADSAVIANGDTIYEGCPSIILKFIRTGSTNDTIYYTITGTATNGSDYNFLQGYVVFPPGVNEVSVNIIPTQDYTSENYETLTITVTNTIACGPQFSVSITFVISDALPLYVTAPPDTSLICPNQPLTLTAIATGGSGNYNYSWSTNQTTNSITIYPQATTTYIVTVTDDCGTSISDSVTVFLENYAPLQLFASNDTTICLGESVLLTANATGGVGEYIFSWSNGLGNNDSVYVTPLSTTTYTISITDSCNISITENITINVIEVIANFTYDYETNNRINFYNQSVSADNYFWDFGDGVGTSTQPSPTYTFENPDTFIVMLIAYNNSGCSDTFMYPIIAYPELKFFVPNTFTPNDDEINDFFFGKGQGYVKYEMTIFNRWGQKIYESAPEEARPMWDGKNSKGKPLAQGVYLYLINIQTPIGKIITKRGTISLIR